MTVTDIRKDLDALTLTVTAEYDVTAERAWRLWADPRQLERWWGPPTYPATVVEHDLRPGGTVHYYMTGPEGDQPHGGWEVLAVDPPRHLEVRDYFADADGVQLEGMPDGRMVVDIADREGGGVVMTITSRHPSREALEQVLAMGMAEGMREAMGQIDEILAEQHV
ncbi:MAG: SRPBCC domain-containing protein [Candidatus Nanopelagicales bacterium]